MPTGKLVKSQRRVACFDAEFKTGNKRSGKHVLRRKSDAPYIFLASCLIKYRDKIYLYLYIASLLEDRDRTLTLKPYQRSTPTHNDNGRNRASKVI
jgi:hypothetical protein